ncbi:MAG: UDP-4-amino-4,6-dideoxy-N-acetyl-beta-L-altrosamine transaminase [Actinobacteria bacterium]|uniref:Unannotated protein n=1 Tax=freshwater metagenome TaxID=449393 RepID=A0A6J7WBX6_9ZZZZ|nr:UDP-4-amino-4,6-dideoxy-N-acetyl-beta-L-altrosamine transaminase [Actinomycetota bacterium]
MIPYGKHSVNWRDVFAVARQTGTGTLTQGNRISDFENSVANYVGVKYAVAVSSATAGLHLSLLALNLDEGSKVITSPISFVASANSSFYAKLTPKFVDIESSTININPSAIKRSLASSKDVRAIVPVHYGGMTCDMFEISQIAKKDNLRVVEDAAHALGARYESGEMVGSCTYSDATVFSFHPVKSITTGEGGMITTNDKDVYLRLLRLRSHGINKLDDQFENLELALTNDGVNPWYYEMMTLGYNYRLSEIQAALGMSQMKRIDNFIQKRNKLADKYDEAFDGTPNITIAQRPKKDMSSRHIYVLRFNFEKLKKSRNQVMQELRNSGIMTQVHYIPIPLQPYYSRMGYNMEELPEAATFYNQALTIPLFPDLKKREQKRIISAVIKIASGK